MNSKHERLEKFLRNHPGTWTMADIFSMIAGDGIQSPGFGESVGEVTIRKVVRRVAEKNGSKRWTTWTICPAIEG